MGMKSSFLLYFSKVIALSKESFSIHFLQGTYSSVRRCSTYTKHYLFGDATTITALSAEKPKRKKGFDKDGNPKEKRPPSAYNIFVKEKYAEIKEANPEMDKTQIFAEIARIWQELKAAQAEEANKKKTDPTTEIEEIQEEEPSDEEAPKKKRGRKPNKPETTEAWNE
jgi:hypothetical protein